jgi:hypothetical protein
MANQRIIEIASRALLKEHPREFLHIASLPTQVAPGARIARSQAAAVLRVGHAIADFALNWSMCRWDKNFHFLGSMVFIRFPRNDLLAADAPGSDDAVVGLRDFDRWQTAWVIMNEGMREALLQRPAERMTEEDATETITKFRSEKAPSGESKHATFLQWAADHARVDGYEWMAHTIDGDGLASWMPPKMLLRRRGGPNPGGTPVQRDERYVVRARRMVRLITGVGQARFLLADRPGAPVPGRHDIFRYPLDARKAVKRWIAVE